MNFPEHKDTVPWQVAFVIWSSGTTQYLHVTPNQQTTTVPKSEKWDLVPTEWNKTPWRAGWVR